jgi:uncharacterized protein with PhoU and TrkA domain
MSGREKYLGYAQHCIQLAQKVHQADDRLKLLQMAQTWQRLADRAEDITRLVEDDKALGVIPPKAEMQ